MSEAIKVLDHGYVRFVEAWGHGDAGNGVRADASMGADGEDDYECGILEAARQSTQGSFRGWEDVKCLRCEGMKEVVRVDGPSANNVGVAPAYPHTPVGQRMSCARCEGKGYLPGDARLLKFLFSGRPQHATPFEFAGMTVEVQAPIMVFREWHRHRVQSYYETAFDMDGLDDTAFNEMSARYAPLPDLNYVPPVERCLRVSATNKQAGAVKGSDPVTARAAADWQVALDLFYRSAENLYQTGLSLGLPKELARLCLPAGRYSRMRATTNLRNWLAFMTLRADPAAQWEIQRFAEAVGSIIGEKFPRTWFLYNELRAKENKT